MKPLDYIVIASLGNRSRRLVWNTEERMAVDHPERWFLEHSKDGVLVRDVSAKGTTRGIWITDEMIAASEPVELPAPINGSRRPMTIRLVPLKPIRPAYMPSVSPPEEPASVANRVSQLFIYQGVRDFLVKYTRTPRGEHKAYINNRLVFEFSRGKEKGIYRFKSAQENVTLIGPYHRKVLQSFVVEEITEEMLTEGKIEWGNHWWRINRITIPPALPPKALALEEETTPEAVWFKTASQAMAGAFMALVLLIAFYPTSKHLAKNDVAPTQVALKAPKIIPAKPEPVKIEPKIVAVPVPKAEPKRLAASEPPQKAASKPGSQPARKQAAVPPPKAGLGGGPAPAPIPTAAENAAKNQAKLASSLSFLSPSQNRAMANISQGTNSKKYAATANAVDPKQGDSSVLKHMAVGGTGIGDGPINTRAARNIDSDVRLEGGVPGGKGKTLNGVQGKVSVAALYDPNAGGDLGSSLSGKGISMSGSGAIPEGLVEKVLGKHVEKFQYCYEKALLSDASLSGNVVMQWTVQMNGSSTDVKVVRSQLNNSALHQCLAKELARIRFPAPSGGAVTIKYPLAFSSASL